MLLRRPANFAWYTGGGDNRVDHASPAGVAAALVTRERDYVVCSDIEAARMRAEQTPDIEVVGHPWTDDPVEVARELSRGGILDADIETPGAMNAGDEVAPLRYVLDAEAIATYGGVGRDAVAALSEAAAEVRPGVQERELAAVLVAACRRRGLFAPVVLVAADDRIARYRHPLPGDPKVARRAMLVVCAERSGLYANVTTFVDLAAPDGLTQRKMDACERILLRMRGATRAGRTLGELFEDCRRAYADEKFPDEWLRHHQGGLTGYASREVIAVPAHSLRVAEGMAFAWNPSVTGAKAEETFVLTPDGPDVIASAPVSRR